MFNSGNYGFQENICTLSNWDHEVIFNFALIMKTSLPLNFLINFKSNLNADCWARLRWYLLLLTIRINPYGFPILTFIIAIFYLRHSFILFIILHFLQTVNRPGQITLLGIILLWFREASYHHTRFKTRITVALLADNSYRHSIRKWLH